MTLREPLFGAKRQAENAELAFEWLAEPFSRP